MYNPVNSSCKGGGGELHGRDEKWPTYTTVRIIRCSSSLSFSFGRIFVMRRLICTIAFRRTAYQVLFFLFSL